MVKISKLLKDKKYIVFIDLEATQTTHEAIALGAVKVQIGQNYTIKKYYRPFLRYIKCDSNIGKIVEDLTNLNNKIINIKGKDFKDVLIDFKQYVGDCFSTCAYMSFGNYDLKILNKTLEFHQDANQQICEQIFANHIDFLKIISKFINDNDHMPYSLINYCKLFNITMQTPNHSPENDAINLAKLYDAFLKRKDVVFEEYKKSITHIQNLDEPLIEIINKLNNEEDISYKEFQITLRKYINDKLS